MKYVVYIVNGLLVLFIPIVFIMTPVKKQVPKTIQKNILVKQLKSGSIRTLEKQNVEEIHEKLVELEEKETKEKEDTKEVLAVKEEIATSIEEKTEECVEEENKTIEEVPKEEKKEEVLESLNGKMSGYGPDCIGCSGYLASGRYVGNGNIYYPDSTYGTVRILAGDSKYAFGTIVRVKNSNIGTFLGIILDRGGSIGIGKAFLFDLLYSSEAMAAKDEVSYHATFEILRYGY